MNTFYLMLLSMAIDITANDWSYDPSNMTSETDFHHRPLLLYIRRWCWEMHKGRYDVYV